MSTVDLTRAVWRKSSRSDGNNGQCVEVADNLADIVAVRDTKDQGKGPILCFAPEQWSAFVGSVQNGDFDI
jgi:hypothetical protein